MLHFLQQKTTRISGAASLMTMFFVVFVFGCIITFSKTAMTMADTMSSSEYTTSSMNDHTNGHMEITLSLPQSPERGILFIALTLLLASISVLVGIILAHAIQTQLTWHMRKERILLFNPIISRLRTGIINPKIF